MAAVYDEAVMTMIRRAVFAALLAGTTGIILRVFGGDGAPPQSGGWRELRPDELN